MNLSQAEYFLTVAEQQSFTLAAKMLYVSQPALSKQISLLEQELGTKLLLRNNKRVCLTEAGKVFQEDLKKIMNDLEEAKDRVRKIGSMEKKQIRIGCFDGIIVDDFLPDILEKIKGSDKEISLELERGTFQEIRKKLAEDKVDIIFTMGFEKDSLYAYCSRDIIARRGGLIYSEILEDRKRKTIDDFKNMALLLMDPAVSPGGYHQQLKFAGELGLDPVTVKPMKDMMTLITYLEMGKGFAFLDENVVKERNRLRAIPLPGGVARQKVIGAWKKENAAAQAVMDALKDDNL